MTLGSTLWLTKAQKKTLNRAYLRTGLPEHCRPSRYYEVWTSPDQFYSFWDAELVRYGKSPMFSAVRDPTVEQGWIKQEQDEDDADESLQHCSAPSQSLSATLQPKMEPRPRRVDLVPRANLRPRPSMAPELRNDGPKAEQPPLLRPPGMPAMMPVGSVRCSMAPAAGTLPGKPPPAARPSCRPRMRPRPLAKTRPVTPPSPRPKAELPLPPGMTLPPPAIREAEPARVLPAEQRHPVIGKFTPEEATTAKVNLIETITWKDAHGLAHSQSVQVGEGLVQKGPRALTATEALEAASKVAADQNLQTSVVIGRQVKRREAPPEMGSGDRSQQPRASHSKRPKAAAPHHGASASSSTAVAVQEHSHRWYHHPPIGAPLRTSPQARKGRDPSRKKDSSRRSPRRHSRSDRHHSKKERSRSHHRAPDPPPPAQSRRHRETPRQDRHQPRAKPMAATPTRTRAATAAAQSSRPPPWKVQEEKEAPWKGRRGEPTPYPTWPNSRVFAKSTGKAKPMPPPPARAHFLQHQLGAAKLRAEAKSAEPKPTIVPWREDPLRGANFGTEW